jgi:hypothetical protein
MSLLFSDSINTRFYLSASYFKCATYNQTEWILNVNNNQQPLSIFGVYFSDFSVQAPGIKQLTNNTNTTYWSGVVSGTLDFSEASLSSSGSITFDSINRVSLLQTGTTFTSEYVDMTLNLKYYATSSCGSVLFNQDDVSTYQGSSGSGSITIKSIFLFFSKQRGENLNIFFFYYLYTLDRTL